MTHAASRPFAFDTEFDDAGQVVSVSAFRPVKRAYAPAEVEALVAQARLEARTQALAECEAIQAMALAEIGRAMAEALPTLAAGVARHRDEAAGLALACARTVAASALDALPEAPLKAALEQLAQEIDASPRLTVRTRDGDAGVQARLAALAADAGFGGQVAFRDDPSTPVAAFTLEWADGRATFDPAEAQARIAQAVAAALASTQTETPIPGGTENDR